MGAGTNEKGFPLWFRLVYTFFFSIIMYVNFFHYGWRNILWFSHVALILLFVGIWSGKRLYISMAGVSVLVFHSLWTISFFAQLLFGLELGGVSYMFDSATPLFLRSVSLFHIFTPPLITIILSKTGYDRKAFRYQKVWGAFVIIMTYFLSPEKNINWVHGPVNPQNLLNPHFYLLVLITGLITIVYYPTHLVLDKKFGDKPS